MKVVLRDRKDFCGIVRLVYGIVKLCCGIVGLCCGIVWLLCGIVSCCFAESYCFIFTKVKLFKNVIPTQNNLSMHMPSWFLLTTFRHRYSIILTKPNISKHVNKFFK